MSDRIVIDESVRKLAQQYVNAQLAVIEKYGDNPILSAQQYGDLVYECAVPVQRVLIVRRKRYDP